MQMNFMNFFLYYSLSSFVGVRLELSTFFLLAALFFPSFDSHSHSFSFFSYVSGIRNESEKKRASRDEEEKIRFRGSEAVQREKSR